MSGTKRWVAILKYIAGAAGLVLSVAVAWLLPEWYSEWQDSKLVGQVTVSSREETVFLDTELIDIAERIRLLGEHSDIYWESTDYGPWIGYIDEELFVTELMQKVELELELWGENGLIPDIAVEIVREAVERMDLGCEYCCIYLDEGVLFVWEIEFWSADGSSVVSLIMDSELNFLYYVSLSGGKQIQEEIAQYLGYESLMEIYTEFQETAPGLRTNAAVPDFAGICGAASADVSAMEGAIEESMMVNCDAELHFEDFSGYAYRQLIHSGAGYGIASMYGTMDWENVAFRYYEYSTGYDASAYGCWPGEWLTYVGDMMLYDELPAAESYGTDSYTDAYSGDDLPVETELADKWY